MKLLIKTIVFMSATIISQLSYAGNMSIIEYLSEISNKETSEIQRVFWGLEERRGIEGPLDNESIYQKILLSGLLAKQNEHERFGSARLSNYLTFLKTTIGKDATANVLKDFIKKSDSEFKPFTDASFDDMYEHRKGKAFVKNELAEVTKIIKLLEDILSQVRTFLNFSIALPTKEELISKYGKPKDLKELSLEELF